MYQKMTHTLEDLKKLAAVELRNGRKDQVCRREPIGGHAEKMRKDTPEMKKEESRRKFTL